MASTDMSGREQGYYEGLGERIAGFMTAVVDGDAAAKQASLERLKEVIAMDNVPYESEVAIPGLDPIKIAISVPAVAVAELPTFAPEYADFKTSLDVSESATDQTNFSSSVDSETTANAKFGFFGAGGSVKNKTTVRAGVDGSRARSGDYNAKMDVSIHMIQQPRSETMNILSDMMAKCAQKSVDIAMTMVDNQAKAAMENIDEKTDVGSVE